MTRKFKLITALLTGAVFPIAFDSGKWKMDGDKLALDANGNPIYLKDDGSEQSVDGGTISRLNGEAKNHRERAERAEAALEPFKGLDATAAKKAIDTLGKIDQKKLIDAGEVDKVRDEIGKSYTSQIAEKDKAIEGLQDRVNGMTLQTAFGKSEFIRERIAVPAEMFEAQFGRNFKVEDGKVIPYGADGNKVYSKKRMGEVADVDEALEIIVESYAHKDAILKAPNAGGSGNGGGGGGRGGGRVVKRSDFAALNPMDQAAAAASAAKGEIQIVD